MKIMWVDEQVEAIVEFPRGLGFPQLRAIRFRDEEIALSSPTRVDVTPTALVYRACSSQREVTVRFETARQRWVLETVRSRALSA